MSHNSTLDFDVEQFEETDENDVDDFVFVLGPDGQLKSMLIPEHLMNDLPDEAQLILEIFGINDIHQLGSRTLH